MVPALEKLTQVRLFILEQLELGVTPSLTLFGVHKRKFTTTGVVFRSISSLGARTQ